jgi:hypothetical protein
LPPDVYKRRLAGFPSLAHLTIEVNACPDHTQVREESGRLLWIGNSPLGGLRRAR